MTDFITPELINGILLIITSVAGSYTVYAKKKGKEVENVLVEKVTQVESVLNEGVEIVQKINEIFEDNVLTQEEIDALKQECLEFIEAGKALLNR